jgi:hypothetical protein
MKVVPLAQKKSIFFALCVVVALLMIHTLIRTTDKFEDLVMITRTSDKLLELSRYVLVDGLKDAGNVPVSKQDEILDANLPSLPYVAWKANKEHRWNLKCGQYPYIFDVPFYNTYWQTAKLRNYTLQIYGKLIIGEK